MTLLPRTPSPVLRFPDSSGEGGALWVKDDGQLHPRYGGNKVRKLSRLLADAAERGAKRVVTFGAAGSHHVLTTALFAPDFGLSVAALLGPQPATAHAEAVLRASLAQGIEAIPLSSLAQLPLALLRSWRRGDYLIGPGGSSLLGTLAYVDAVVELTEQVARAELPMPDVIVVALGSGGTAAGLLAGIVQQRLATRVVAVQVVDNAFSRSLVLGLAARALHARGVAVSGLSARLSISRAELGRGYGHESAAGRAARSWAKAAGLRVEPTYTEKALAHALGLAARPAAGKKPVVLYWHTLSASDPRSLVEDFEAPLPDRLASLLRISAPRPKHSSHDGQVVDCLVDSERGGVADGVGAARLRAARRILGCGARGRRDWHPQFPIRQAAVRRARRGHARFGLPVRVRHALAGRRDFAEGGRRLLEQPAYCVVRARAVRCALDQRRQYHLGAGDLVNSAGARANSRSQRSG
ncbi:MAG: pyridoxal-phosphate dependent enzyme [Polyangiaceae bacterium]